MQEIIFIDTEIGVTDKKIHDIGALDASGRTFHSARQDELLHFIKDAEYICGHNIISHDLKFLTALQGTEKRLKPIDTLYLSPLLFPQHPYHALVKDEKLQSEELNNPVNDCIKAKQLFEDETAAFKALPEQLRHIFYNLLKNTEGFKGFFEYINYTSFSPRAILDFIRHDDLGIKEFFKGKICENADLASLIRQHPVELAYSLALINVEDDISIFPPWTLKKYPYIYNVIRILKTRRCAGGCGYCNEKLNIRKGLHKFFGYSGFRTYGGEPLQEKAVQAAVDGKSLLAVFPTGGGKSITFQLPALMAGQNSHGLTVVISPLQSLMKDQIDKLNEAGITCAVTINGLLSAVERADAFRRVQEGSAWLLYISPEMLRSRTVEHMLMNRNIIRFVIDEAHCFSSWGQDFRIDYLYIADFIKKLQAGKANGERIAVSCFTATAKQKVISDIRDYFKDKLDLDLEIFASSSSRENLTYNVLYKETEEEKYIELRNLIERKNCPTVVYVSRTRATVELARKLTEDGFPATAFNGKMSSGEKIEHQDAFLDDKVRIIVATSAFGMGIDKKDIGLVIHYDISDSLENYVQESGRAGRDFSIQAECYVLYNDNDLDKHFILLNQTKLSISEIQQVWQAIKHLSGNRRKICCSALELARAAGWDCGVNEIETRVKTAVASLENAGYIKRGNNMPRVYATSILVRNMDEARQHIESSPLFADKTLQTNAIRIIKSLISNKNKSLASNDAEARVDYLADILGIPKQEVISVVELLRQDKVLADTQDMTAYISDDDTGRRASGQLDKFARLEKFLLEQIKDGCTNEFNLKELNTRAEAAGIQAASVKNITTVLHFLTTRQYINKEEFKGSSLIKLTAIRPKEKIIEKFGHRTDICRFIIDYFHSRQESAVKEEGARQGSEKTVMFSLVGLHSSYTTQSVFSQISLDDIQEALLYLSRTGILRLEGGFMVTYNAMEITRLERDNRIRYKIEDYAKLNEFYTQKIQQIHIVGEFANMMVRDYSSALQFVQDYFQMDYRQFINKYFQGDKTGRLNKNITSKRYEALFGNLSAQQKRIIDDNESGHIVVVAGPGSGKTRVLVHKLAAILTMEDVKHEQLLMVTFSRAAATEFKIRLKGLIGNAANFVEIKTFHSYCFDLIGKVGNLDEAANVVQEAVRMIRSGEVEPERIAKRVLVIDEAQDMDKNEFDLVCALMEANDGMRVIAVGDDDQNIYEFRGSDTKYMRSLINDYDAKMYELVENYRSCRNIVQCSNSFARNISHRLKNQEITAFSQEPGYVGLISHAGPNMEEAVVGQLLQHPYNGSSCIMTATNDEAFRILGLLHKNGINANLIQSNDGFSLYNLAELRFFSKALAGDSPVISDTLWQNAKTRLQERYAGSTCLEMCMEMISDFEQTSQSKYRSDWEEFARESRLEDFYREKQGTVYVSTIHKSKGREFDKVYIMLANADARQDQELRKLYVAMTRARKELYIHYYQTPVIDRLPAGYAVRTAESRLFPEPVEIVLQLTLKDLYLDFYKRKDRKAQILSLRSGHRIALEDTVITAIAEDRKIEIGKLSAACISKLQKLKDKGYNVTRGYIRFIVAWKGKDDDSESAVAIPEFYLMKL